MSRLSRDTWLSYAWLTQAGVQWAERDPIGLLAGASPTNGSLELSLPLPYIYIYIPHHRTSLAASLRPAYVPFLACPQFVSICMREKLGSVSVNCCIM
jgi:hypothetical protein